MKNKKENSIESELVQFCEFHGIITYKMKGNRGTPDRVFFKDGACAVMELKQTNGTISKLQRMEIDKLWKGGIPTFIPFNLEQAKVLLSKRFSLPGIDTHITF